ncbi:hypothetical protein AB0D32_20095 [Micromonospora sp. NPDC048170]|uniref:hypothetical protein n=1 Tax=Micromonospora sp. NPDC048170 TaxID=3154819 RepID=UPI0033CC4AA4
MSKKKMGRRRGGKRPPSSGDAAGSGAVREAQEANKIAKRAINVSIRLGVAGLVFAAGGLAFNGYQALKPGPVKIGPKLEVSAFSAEKLSKIDAQVFDLSYPAGSSKVDGLVFDVVLKNVGDQVAVVSAVDMVFRRSTEIRLCEMGGGTMTVAGRYDIKISFPERATPFHVRREVRHEIRAGDTERIAVSVGIDEAPLYSSLWLYQIDMSIASDMPGGAVKAGTGLIVTPVPKKGYFLDQKKLAEPGCPEKTLERVKEFSSLPGARPAIFGEMIDELTRYAAMH